MATSSVTEMERIRGWGHTLLSQLGQDARHCQDLNAVQADAVEKLRAAITQNSVEGDPYTKRAPCYIAGNNPSYDELALLCNFQPAMIDAT
jgi:hypothetical protein